MKRRNETEEIEMYVAKCNNCEESINYTSKNQFPIKLKCPQCGRELKIEQPETSK